jgi:hypothetical protein
VGLIAGQRVDLDRGQGGAYSWTKGRLGERSRLGLYVDNG